MEMFIFNKKTNNLELKPVFNKYLFNNYFS